MDVEPIYELRGRLRAAAIAGTNLLSEDFRLRRAYEAFKPLEAASPVFAKVGHAVAELLASDSQGSQGILLDTISLVDAVVCTLGTVEVQGALESADTIRTGEVIVNAPCSKAKALIEALTTSGSGNYSFVCDMRVSDPWIFEDYRIRYAMVQALGASYAELAEMVKGWLEDEGGTMIPLLKKDFDPKGKKEMVRRLQLIVKIAGAAENDFYIKMLETATGEVRSMLIEALRYEPSNTELLIDLQKTEKGKNKQLVLNMLAMIEDERCYELFHGLTAKMQLSQVCEILYPSTTECASRVTVELCDRQFADILALPEIERACAEADKLMSAFCLMVRALVGKRGDAVCECYRKLLLHMDVLEQTGRRKPMIDILVFPQEMTQASEWFWGNMRLDSLGNYKFPVRSRELTWEVVIGSLMAQSLIVYPDPGLMEMVMELYEKDKNINFLAAAVVVKILGEEDCVSWLDANAADQAALDEAERALVCFSWNRKIKSYVVDMEYQNIRGDSRGTIFRKVRISHAKEIAGWMQQHRGPATDAIINRWIDTTDTAECEKYGRYFYERASAIVDNEEYLLYMRNCGWKQCKGLGTDYAKIKIRSDGLQKLNNYLHNLPGDEQTLLEETGAVADMVRSGEVELRVLDTPKSIEIWASHLRDLSVYNALRDR